MDIYNARVKTKQNILLDGLDLKVQSDTCVVYVPGLAGKFDNLGKIVALFCKNNKINFIWARTQSCFIETEVIKINENKAIKVPSGAEYDNFDNSIYDVSAWAKYALQKHKKLVFIGHCYGCNKITYFLSQFHSEKFKECIFIAPADFFNIFTDPRHYGLLEEAIKNVKAQQPNKILSRTVLGFCPMTSAAFLRMGYNPRLNNIPYISNGNFSQLNNINLPLSVIIGSQDRGLGKDVSDDTAEKYIKNIANSYKNTTYYIIKGAKHSFKENEYKI